MQGGSLLGHRFQELLSALIFFLDAAVNFCCRKTVFFQGLDQGLQRVQINRLQRGDDFAGKIISKRYCICAALFNQAVQINFT